MALVRSSDTVDLRSSTFAAAGQPTAEGPGRGQLGGGPATTEPPCLSSARGPDGDDASPPKEARGGRHLAVARQRLADQLQRTRSRRLQQETSYIERHMSSDGTLFPPRPRFMFKVGRPDSTRQHWTARRAPRQEAAPAWYRGETRTAKTTRYWIKNSEARHTPKWWWRRAMRTEMTFKLRQWWFDSEEEREEARRMRRILTQSSL